LPAQGNRFQLIGEQSTGLTPTRDVQVYITPATIRSFNEETLRLKELTNEYSNLAKEISQGNLENQEEFTNLQHKILDAYQEHIQDKVSKIRRSEEHTSELQSRENLVCRLLLEKKKKK